MTNLDQLFARHTNIAVQVSGGKDSLALLRFLRPWLHRVCVYWMNPGDPFPATVEQMEKIAASVPRFKEVRGRQPEIIAADGWPFDVVPVRWTSAGHFMEGRLPFKVQGRFDCCWRSLMLPMHEAMVVDKITCVIRGKRSDEDDKTESRTGDVIEGIEFVYPLWDWSADDVLDYLASNKISLPESYQYAKTSFECMSCTAWAGNGIDRFLAAKHPEQHNEYVRRVNLIKSAIAEELLKCEV